MEIRLQTALKFASDADRTTFIDWFEAEYAGQARTECSKFSMGDLHKLILTADFGRGVEFTNTIDGEKIIPSAVQNYPNSQALLGRAEVEAVERYAISRPVPKISSNWNPTV